VRTSMCLPGGASEEAIENTHPVARPDALRRGPLPGGPTGPGASTVPRLGNSDVSVARMRSTVPELRNLGGHPGRSPGWELRAGEARSGRGHGMVFSDGFLGMLLQEGTCLCAAAASPPPAPCLELPEPGGFGCAKGMPLLFRRGAFRAALPTGCSRPGPGATAQARWATPASSLPMEPRRRDEHHPPPPGPSRGVQGMGSAGADLDAMSRIPVSRTGPSPGCDPGRS